MSKNQMVETLDPADFLKYYEVVGMNRRSLQPVIHVYLKKETGKPENDTIVSQEDPPTAKVAMKWLERRFTSKQTKSLS